MKIILLGLASALLVPPADRTQYFVHLSFNQNFQLINGISSDLQKLLKYFNGTGIVAFLKIPFPHSASVFSNNLVLIILYSKDLK